MMLTLYPKLSSLDSASPTAPGDIRETTANGDIIIATKHGDAQFPSCTGHAQHLAHAQNICHAGMTMHMSRHAHVLHHPPVTSAPQPTCRDASQLIRGVMTPMRSANHNQYEFHHRGPFVTVEHTASAVHTLVSSQYCNPPGFQRMSERRAGGELATCKELLTRTSSQFTTYTSAWEKVLKLTILRDLWVLPDASPTAATPRKQ
eukprot:3754375-Amphidinium_carterae.1